MNYKKPIFIFSLISITFLIYAGFILTSIWPIDSKTLGQAGVFGDSFGILTALFSALAFGGLMITIWQQQDEIKESRSEIKKQHFENLLFRMLEVHTGIVRDLDINSTKTQKQVCAGRDCFPGWSRILKAKYRATRGKGLNEKERMQEMYEEFWDKWNKDLGHYFRFLYNIIKHIDSSEEENKKKYTNIIRAQLSDYELVMIFYNCLYIHGRDKFKPLIEKYALLDNLPVDLIFNNEHLTEYSQKAYGA